MWKHLLQKPRLPRCLGKLYQVVGLVQLLDGGRAVKHVHDRSGGHRLKDANGHTLQQGHLLSQPSHLGEPNVGDDDDMHKHHATAEYNAITHFHYIPQPWNKGLFALSTYAWQKGLHAAQQPNSTENDIWQHSWVGKGLLPSQHSWHPAGATKFPHSPYTSKIVYENHGQCCVTVQR